MSNVTVVRISGGPESLYTNITASTARASSPEPEPADATTVTFTNGRVTLKVDGSGSTGLPRRPQRTRRRTQLVHHRDRHLRQEVKVVRYLPSPKAAPSPRRLSTTSDAATSTDGNTSVDADTSVDASVGTSPVPSSAASSADELPVSLPPPDGLRYRLSLAEQYQNQLFTEPCYVISAPAAFAGDWAASSDAHDSGLEGSESDGAARSDRSSGKDAARQRPKACDVTDGGLRGSGSERSGSPAEEVADSRLPVAREEEEGYGCTSAADESGYCCIPAAEESGYSLASVTEESSCCCAPDGGEPRYRCASVSDKPAYCRSAAAEKVGDLYTATSEESGYCYIPAKEQRECSQEVLIVVNERVSPADLAASEDDEDGSAAEPAASRKVSDASSIDRHFYFGEEGSLTGGEEGSVTGGESSAARTELTADQRPQLTVHNLRRLEELQSRSALPASFLAFKQALLESGDMSGLRKADLYTVLGGTVRGYPASWDDLGSKFDEPDAPSDASPAADADARSGVSIDAWTVDRRGRYRAVGRGAMRPICPRRAAADALAALGADSDSWYPLCVRCEDTVYPQDGVRPAPDAVYHVACLRCDTCDHVLGRDEVRVAGRLVFCGLHAPAGAVLCRPGSKHSSCSSSTNGQQVPTRTAQ